MKALEAKLRKLPQASLVGMVVDIYGHYGDIDDIIESHVDLTQVADGKLGALHASVARQIELLLHGDDFIAYRDGYDFSCRLQSLLLDIQNLAEEGPAPALQLLDAMIGAHGEVMARADDSGGDIGSAFRDAVDLWLSVAGELRVIEPEARNWVDCVARFYAANDYGCLDDVIAHSAGLLSEAELKQMAARFESDAYAALKKAAKKTDPLAFNHDAAHACIGVKAVALALRDFALFEKGLLITSPAKETTAVSALVAKLAADHRDAAQAIDMLMALQNTKLAAAVLVDRDEEIAGTHYFTLLDWVKAFEAAGEAPASILCYRHLLTDLLDRGFSKAYHHGADYFRRLLVLDKKKPDYRMFANAQQCIVILQNKHWRKRSFWQQAGHPPKSSDSKRDAGWL